MSRANCGRRCSLLDGIFSRRRASECCDVCGTPGCDAGAGILQQADKVQEAQPAEPQGPAIPPAQMAPSPAKPLQAKPPAAAPKPESGPPPTPSGAKSARLWFLPSPHNAMIPTPLTP
jgi:hypothetical protein